MNDTTREIGTALGIALMGSMFNTGYRQAIDGDLARPAGRRRRPGSGGTGPGARRRGHLGDRGDALAAAATDAFASGMRLSMVVGATLLLGAAAYVWLRGPSREDEVLEDVVDDDPAARLAAHPVLDLDQPLVVALDLVD